jgi:predicted lipoprotein with Yx(FWY)xxD motif
MRQPMKVLIPTLAASVVLSACGSSSGGTGSTSATEGRPPAPQSSGGGSASAQVKTAANARLGTTVLVDDRGMTLYHLTAEHNGKFICTNSACLQLWHPLTVPTGGSASGTVGSLATIKRPDGTEQVTYKGQPLYTFAQDQTAGQVNGQGFKDVGTWMAGGAGASATSTAPSTTGSPAPSSSSGEGSSKGGGYGY